MACAGLGCVSLSATAVIIKLVCATAQYDCLLFNDKLINLDMEESCLLRAHVVAAAVLLAL